MVKEKRGLSAFSLHYVWLLRVRSARKRTRSAQRLGKKIRGFLVFEFVCYVKRAKNV
jgi:hypothetical protein